MQQNHQEQQQQQEQQEQKDNNEEEGEDDDDDQGGVQFGDDDGGDENQNVNSMASSSNGANASANAAGGNGGGSTTKTPTTGQRGDAAASASASASGSTRRASSNPPASHAGGHGRTGISTAAAGNGGGSNNNSNGGSVRRRPILPPPLTTTRRLFTPDALPSNGRDDLSSSSSSSSNGDSCRGASGRNSSARVHRRRPPRLLNSGGESANGSGSASASTSTSTTRDRSSNGPPGAGTRTDGTADHSAAVGRGPAPERQIRVGPDEEDPTFDWTGLFGRSRFPHRAVPSVSVETDAPTYAAELVRARNEGFPMVIQDAKGWAHFCCRWMIRCDDGIGVAGRDQHQEGEEEEEEERYTYFLDRPDPAKAAMTFPLCRYVEEGWSIDLDRMRMDLGHSLVPLSIFEPSGGGSSSSSSSTGTAIGGSSEPSFVHREVQRVSLWTALPLIFKEYFSSDDEGAADLQGCPPGCRYAINDFKFTDCTNASSKLSAQCSTCLEGALGFDILSLSLGAELLPGRTIQGGELLGDNPFQYLSIGPKGTRVETKDAVCGLIRTDGNLDATFCILSGSVEFVVTHRSSMAILTEMKPSITPEGIEAERCCRPGASKIQSYRAVLGPGDIIFIPTGCLHSIQYLSNCVMYQRLHCTASNVSDYARSLLRGNGPKGCEDERCAYFHNMAEGMCIAVNHETEHAQNYVQMGEAGRHVVAGLKQHVDRELKDVALGLISIRYMLWVLVQKMKAEEPVGLFEPYTRETWEKLLDTVDRCLHAFEFRFCVTVPPFQARGY